MQLIKKKSFQSRVKNLASKISDDNLFMLSSSISYYSALAIAPFILILLGVSSLLGVGVQGKMLKMASDFSPEVGKLVELIFSNVNEGVNFGSVSGIIGIIILLSTASLVFLQLRYSLDVIYGLHPNSANKGLMDTVKEKIFAMFFVVMTGLFFILSTSFAGIISFIFKGTDSYFVYKGGVYILNFLIYVGMFWGIHYYTPSKKPVPMEALKMGLLSATFFVVGNLFLASYLKGVASGSIYGAAGTLLVFLIWSYYSSFTLFLSAEIFLYFKKMRKI